MLALNQRQLRRAPSKLEEGHTYVPLLNFGRLHEVSASHTPILFGRVAVPVEIFYTVLDAFRQEPAALAACARVCKAWYYGAREHLFRAVHIRESIATYLFYPFARTLRTTPSVQPLVKSLHLELCAPRQLLLDHEVMCERSEFNLRALANLVQRLPMLEELVFTNAFWSLEEGTAVPRISHPRVRTLTFVHLTNRHLDPRVHDIVRWFPNLKSLHVDSEYTTRAAFLPEDPMWRGLRLEHIDITSGIYTNNRLLRDISETDSGKSIKTFTYRVSHSSVAPLGVFLGKAGQSLQDLTLCLQDEFMLEELARTGNYNALNFHNLTKLETLTLELDLFASRAWGNHMRAACSCLNALLSTLSSDKLRSITLRLDVANAKDEFERLELWRWTPYLLRLPALCELVFVVRRGSGFVARRTITSAFASTPYEHMLRFYSIETGAEIPKEFPPHIIRLPRGLNPAEVDVLLFDHVHTIFGGPIQVEYDTDSESGDEGAAEAEIENGTAE